LAFVKQFNLGKYIELQLNSAIVYLFNFIYQLCALAAVGSREFWLLNQVDVGRF